ncbi:MAG: SBBP repeat-containing protein, partial [Ignavibacteria bacterium]|nr:SBBP repeat-containing protein [Ignavibacteria bacterium]
MKKIITFFYLFLFFVFTGSLKSQVKEDWVVRYSFAEKSSVWSDTDIASSVAIDELGNVFVTGGSMRGPDNGEDIVTFKYTPAGVQEWSAIYSGAAKNSDHGNV